MKFLRLLILLPIIAVFAWYLWGRTPRPTRWLGYVDADYVKVAPTTLGQLVSLAVARGDQVAEGAALFAQNDDDERAARDQAQASLKEESEKLADIEGAGRDAEIAAARADLADQKAAHDLVSRDLARAEALLPSGAATRQSVEQLRDQTESARAHVAASQARLDLITSSTGREHAIAAQREAVTAAQAALVSAQWRLDQRHVAAPAAGLIADTFAQPGETVAAGTPVVSLLPPGNILVRFFVPEADLAMIKAGDSVGIVCDSCAPDLHARISFIATQSEYTPPVIYSQTTRAALVYMIEAHPEPGKPPLLKPGQPVDIVPPPGVRGSVHEP
jgi:HlyD family secretion protein